MDKELLEILEEKDLHVHVIDHSLGYKDFGDIPLARMVGSTHFVMKGSDIVFVGSVQGVTSYAYRCET